MISAFANRYGGWIIVGVDEDGSTNKPKEIVNVEEDNLSDCIDSICIDRISPPVFCQSAYIVDDDNNRRVFVIKVDESDLTPHAVDFNTTVYIKIKSQKRPYQKADLDQIEWLKQRRDKCVKLRDDLIKRSRDRYSKQFENTTNNVVTAEFIMVPEFPHKFFGPHELLNYTKNVRIDVEGDVRFLNMDSIRTSQDSISYVEKSQNISNHYSELNVYGLYYNKVSFIIKSRNHDLYFSLPDIAFNLLTNIYIGSDILNGMTHKGNVHVYYRVDNMCNKTYLWDMSSDYDPLKNIRLNPIIDDCFEWTENVKVIDLLQKRPNFFISIINSIIFALGGGDEYGNYGQMISNDLLEGNLYSGDY